MFVQLCVCVSASVCLCKCVFVLVFTLFLFPIVDFALNYDTLIHILCFIMINPENGDIL